MTPFSFDDSLAMKLTCKLRCLCIFCRRSPGDEADGWSDMPPADTVACCGMARAAEWLYREVRDARVAPNHSLLVSRYFKA